MMKWNVYYENVNTNEIEEFNVFKHTSFNEDAQKLKKSKLSFEEFSHELNRKAMYYFWSRSEYEVVITSWPPYIDLQEYDKLTKELTSMENKNKMPKKLLDINPYIGAKVDIYSQLCLNWDIFAKYVYDYKFHRGEQR